MITTILHGSNDVYGASRVLLDEVVSLKALGHDVRVVLPATGPLTAELRRLGVDVSVDPQLAVLRRSRLRDALRRPTLPRAARDADVVVLWTLALSLYVPLLSLQRKPHYISVHELLLGRFGSALVRSLVATGKGPVAACSHAVARWLEDHGVKPSRIQVMYPSFTWAVNHGRPSKEVFTVGVVGRVNGHKGHLQVAQAFMDVAEEDWRLILVGAPFPGQEAAQIDVDRVAQTDTRITTAGEVEGFDAVAGQLDLVACFPDRPEPFGLVPIEAWAQGVRAAGFDDGGAAEVLEIVDGVRVDRQADDLPQIASALVAARAERDTWRPPSEAVVRKTLSFDRRVQAVERVLRNLRVRA
jgi:glycosyltransferase involved in cell wall biosynthesis